MWAIVLKFILVFSQPARSSERRRNSDLQEEKVMAFLSGEHLLFISLQTYYTHFLEWRVCLFVCDVLSSLCTGKFFAIGRFLQSDKTPNCTCPNCIKAQWSHIYMGPMYMHIHRLAGRNRHKAKYLQKYHPFPQTPDVRGPWFPFLKRRTDLLPYRDLVP